MQNIRSNLRKAAVLIRSLDNTTAATLLGQLPTGDAAAVRAAVESLGSVDPEEQADVAAEMRRRAPVAGSGTGAGVELLLSTATGGASAQNAAGVYQAVAAAGNSLPSDASAVASPRFEFLEQAPITSLAPYLAREHAQTIAVVLSYLSPSRAAAVLAALSPRQQTDTLERLSALGETDPASVNVVEQELAAWVAAQSSLRRSTRAGGTARAILAAASAATRESIMANLKTHKRHLAAQFGERPKPQTSNSDRRRAAVEPLRGTPRLSTQLDSLRETLATAAAGPSMEVERRRGASGQSTPVPAGTAVRPHFKFDDLVRLDTRSLASVMHDVDANVLTLALAGSSDELVERIVGGMPKRTGKAFRRQLRKLGPTRLSDVEAAQQVVARVAAQRVGRHAVVAATIRK